jgi:outer membrane cobalamin receptor
LRSTLINVDEATTEGVEAFISFIVSEQLRLRADYTYTNAVDARTDQQLLRRPRNKASVSAIFTPIERLTLSTTALFVGEWADVDRATLARVTQPGFVIVNVAANYAVNDQVTAFARLDRNRQLVGGQEIVGERLLHVGPGRVLHELVVDRAKPGTVVQRGQLVAAYP